MRVLVAIALGATAAAADPLPTGSAGRFSDDEPFAAAPFALTVYTRRDGAPENNFYAAARDEHGRLVLGMINGVAQFNGTAFERLDVGPDAPHGTTAYALAVGPEGRRWVGSPTGLYALADGVWRHLGKGAVLPHAGVNAVRYAPGGLFVGTQGGLVVLDPTTLALVDTIDTGDGLPEANIYTTIEVDDGALAGLWIGGPWGLVHRARGATRFTRIELPAEPQEHAVRSLLADRDALWIGTEAGLARLDAGRRGPVFVEELRGAPVGSMARVARGAASWLCVARLAVGVSCLTERGWRTTAVTNDDGSVKYVFAITTAGRANGADVIWLATDAGLVRGVRPAVTTLAGGPPVLSRRIDALVTASDGALWVASGSEVARIAWPGWQTLTTPAGDDIRALAELPGGTLPGLATPAMVAGTSGGSLVAFVALPAGDPVRALVAFATLVDRRIVPLAFPTGSDAPIADLALTPGRLWLGTNGALAAWRSDGRVETVGDGPRSLWVSKLLGAGDELWVGLNSTGLAHRAAAGAWTNLATVEDNVTVTALFRDRAGALWVGTQAAGARRLGSSSMRFDEASSPALPDGTINSIADDTAGRIYLCTNRGIARMTLAGAGFAVRTFNREDGMPDDECSMNAGARVGNRLVFGTMHGLVALAPETIDETPVPGTLVFERARAGDRPLTAGARLDHDDNKLVFDYVLVSPDHAHEIRYQTHLVGAEAEPADWQAATRREFTGLSPGSYELVVTARDHLGVLHGPITHHFRIAPPFWATYWAYAAYVALAALAVFLVVRARLRLLRARAAELEREVEKRTEQVRRQADELREKNVALEEAHRQADRIFAALKEAMPGTTLDDTYLLGEIIGEGGYGVVYRCSEVRSGKQFAAKVFRPKPGNDSPEALERFKREAVSVSRVNHDNAVKVFAGGATPDGLPYIIMELLVGETLEDLLKSQGKLSIARTAEILAPVCDALAAAHAETIVHRDIKPENVFLHRDPGGAAGHDEAIKVLDFGVAKLQENKTEMRSLTMSGSLVGTPHYIAPERLSDQTYDGRSDIYAVGVILYRCLTGQLPFPTDSGNLFAVVIAHLKQAPPPLTSLDPSIPEPVQRIVLATLEKEPARRPSAAALASELRGWGAYSPTR